jgi:vitamin K-dependent gamma-carboxylase
MTDSRGRWAAAARAGSSWLRRLPERLWLPTDAAWLAAFRVCFGLTMCLSMQRFIANGWVESLFLQPSFHFSYFGFEWVRPLPAPLMNALFWVLGGLALAVAAGALFRLTMLLFLFGFSYLQLVDVTTYLNHYYLAFWLGLLLLLSPAGKVWSVDALLSPGPKRFSVSRHWLYTFRFQIACVYTFAALAKATPDWLLHAQPLSIWLGSHTDLPLLGVLFRQPWAAHAMSWAGFLYDLAIPWLLLVPKLRLPAYFVLLAFHGVTALLFPIGMFPVIMSFSALVFFSPSWPRVLWARLRGRLGPVPPAQLEGPHADLQSSGRVGSVWRPRLVALLLVSYALLHIVVPMRYLAYGGNVLWHEQGMRFSWRVMVREKNGSILYVVSSPRTGKVWHVRPTQYLTRLQEREASGQPDLILQLAHRVRDEYGSLGHGPVEVRAQALVSLNGRRAQPLIDPTVDLAKISAGLGRAGWISPAPGGAPPRLRRI